MRTSDVEIYMKALKEKNDQDLKTSIAIAYVAALIQRADKIPKLEQIYKDFGLIEHKEQTPQDMLAIVKMLHNKISAKGDVGG